MKFPWQRPSKEQLLVESLWVEMVQEGGKIYDRIAELQRLVDIVETELQVRLDESLYQINDMWTHFREQGDLTHIPKPPEHPLYAEIHSKGMSGHPVVCICGSVFGDKWGFCKDCGRRTNRLPKRCFPFGRSLQPKIYKAPAVRKSNG